MPKQGLREILSLAQLNAVAVGHFNESDFTMLKAVFGAARRAFFSLCTEGQAPKMRICDRPSRPAST
jgi:hypothetical protein